MAAPKDKHDREHLRRLEVIQRLIDSIYDEAVKEAAAIGVSVGDIDLDKAFEFADYPLTQRRIDELVSWLRGQLQTAVVDGINAAWVLANNKNNVLVQRIFGGDVDELPEPVRRRYLSTNESAREAFLKRKTGGLNLSDRVWRYSQEFKTEIEMGIDLGIRDGKSAQQMARDLKQYLQHPDKLFRRVRDEHGMLHLSKRAADFHPGRGVYRSSYLNARRLAATETNIAYRTADHERWQQMDFVVGIEIHLSNNHTCRGRDGKPHPLTDICDQLKGKYPKDFKFTGWHPHCRCYATSILKTDEEIAEDTKRILNGEPVTGESENRVDDVPDNFKDWVEKNEKRIAEAGNKGTLPGFVRENEKILPDSQKGDSIKSPFSSSKSKKDLPNDFTTVEEAIITLNTVVNNNKGWINGIFDGFKGVPWIGDQIFMQRVPKFDPITQKMHHSIEIVDFDFTVKVLGRKLSFNPMREVRGALYAISKGEKMNFLQEYALESVWHEIMHAGAVNWRNPIIKHDTTSMELINQFCARRTYKQLLKKLGAEPTHEYSIIRHGIGYSREMSNFYSLLDKYGISQEKMFKAFEIKIKAFAYDDIHPMLLEFLKENGVTNPDSFIRKLDKSKKKFSRMLNRAPK